MNSEFHTGANPVLFSSYLLQLVQYTQKVGRQARLFVLVGGTMKPYDVVYILKMDAKPDELKYSLRSVETNLEHKNVWFVGGQPDGLIPDRAIPMFQRGILKWEKARSSLIKACKCEEISDKFWLFNDDFFVLKTMEEETQYFGGMLRDRILSLEHNYGDKRTGYSRALRFCEQMLQDAGYSTFDYALHLPMLVDKKKMLEAIETFPECPMFRSIYGNFSGIGGIQHDDVKVTELRQGVPDGADFVSTEDRSFRFGEVGKQIRELFPDKCKYEI